MPRKSVHNPNQFKLFMTGTELKNAITDSNDIMYGEFMGDMWERKESESRDPEPPTGRAWRPNDHGAGVYDSIKSMGYRGEPIDVHYQDYGGRQRPERTMVFDGHHRIAAAAAIERETGKPVYIPVEHDDGRANEFRMRHQAHKLGLDKKLKPVE